MGLSERLALVWRAVIDRIRQATVSGSVLIGTRASLSMLFRMKVRGDAIVACGTVALLCGYTPYQPKPISYDVGPCEDGQYQEIILGEADGIRKVFSVTVDRVESGAGKSRSVYFVPGKVKLLHNSRTVGIADLEFGSANVITDGVANGAHLEVDYESGRLEVTYSAAPVEKERIAIGVVVSSSDSCRDTKVKRSSSKKTTEGIVLHDDRSEIAVKVWKRKYASIVDELFYKKRLSYTMLTDIGRYRALTICDGCATDDLLVSKAKDWEVKQQISFGSIESVLDFLTDQINGESFDPARPNCFPEFCEHDIRQSRAVALLNKLGDPDRFATANISALRQLKARLAEIERNEKVDSKRSPAEIAVNKLNSLMLTHNLFDAHLLPRMAFSEDLQVFLSGKDWSAEDLLARNRYILDELFSDELVNSRRLAYRRVADGVEFYETNAIPRRGMGDMGPTYLKKMFFYNLTAKEASEKLASLFPLSYQTRIDTSQNQFGGAFYQPMPIPTGVSQPVMTTPTAQTQVTLQFPHGQSGKPTVGYLVPVASQNALLVNAEKAVLDRIGEAFHALDADTQQVLIETKVFEYDDVLARQVGTAIDYVDNGGTDLGIIRTFFQENLADQLFPFFSYGINRGLSATQVKYTLLTSLSLNARDGLVRIMAEPRIVVKPGTEATINLNTTKYVLTNATTAVAGDLKQIDTGVAFKITPTILSEDKIFLETELVQSEFLPNTEANIVQAVNKNTIKTSVTVADGELISIGGIKTKKQQIFSSGIPGLKEIPWVGFAFGSEARDVRDVRIEFMIRPIIKQYRETDQRIYDQVRRTNTEINERLRLRR